jgi:DNA primase catalytic subunit
VTLREDLARKRAQRRQVVFPLGASGEGAKADLDQAKQAVQLAELAGNDDAIKRARNWVRRAQRLLDKHSVKITVRGLTEEERDTLNSAHPATDEIRAEDDAAIKRKEITEDDRRLLDRKSWLPAALELVAIDSDLTEAEWAAELSAPEKWTVGDKQALFVAVIGATNEGPAPGVPFG